MIPIIRAIPGRQAGPLNAARHAPWSVPSGADAASPRAPRRQVGCLQHSAGP